MNALKIEEVLTPPHIREIARLERDCFPLDAWPEPVLANFLAAPIRRAYMLKLKDDYVGYLILTIFDGEAEIERFGVALTYRGHHLGHALFTLVRDELALRRCFLEVSTRNQAAIHLYRSCGFETFSKRRAYYSDGADAYMMEWKRDTHE